MTRRSDLEEELESQLLLADLGPFATEYRFAPPRMWRLDFCWPDHKLAVEIEGGIYRGGGHTSVRGLKRDIEKGNELTLRGYRLLRVHGDMVRDGSALTLIERALKGEQAA